MTTLAPAGNVPEAIEAEKALLGCVLIGAEVWVDVAGKLNPSDFFLVANAEIWAAFGRIAERGDMIDFVLVQAELTAAGKLNDIGGIGYLIELTTAPTSYLHAAMYADLVHAAAMRRRMLQAADAVRALATKMDTPVDECYLEALKMLDAIPVHTRQRFVSGVLSDSVYDDIQWRLAEQRSKGEEIGIPMPPEWRRLTEAVPRLYPGQLVVISGTSGAGKSSFVEALAEHCASQGRRTVYIHTEMSTDDVLHRRAARHTGIPYHTLASGALTAEQRHTLSLAATRMQSWLGNISYRWMPDVQFALLAAEMRRANDSGVEVFLIDHFQDIQPQPSERNEVLAREQIVTWLTNFCEKRGCYVILASQQNADGTTKWSKKPVEKAVVWLSLTRERLETPYDYKLDGQLYSAEAGQYSPIVEVGIEKARFGTLGKVRMLYHGPAYRWYDISQVQRPAPQNKVIPMVREVPVAEGE